MEGSSSQVKLSSTVTIGGMTSAVRMTIIISGAFYNEGTVSDRLVSTRHRT